MNIADLTNPNNNFTTRFIWVEEPDPFHAIRTEPRNVTLLEIDAKGDQRLAENLTRHDARLRWKQLIRAGWVFDKASQPSEPCEN